MRRITIYILKQLAVGTLLVTTGLACLIWLTQSLRFVELIVNRGLSLSVFLNLTVLLLPNFLVIILPIALFAVVLFTYGKLKTDREIVVLMAAGWTRETIAKPALILAGAITVLGYALNLWLVPESFRAFRELQFTIRHKYASILLQEGVFNQVSNGLTVYVRERSDDGKLMGIMVHDSRDQDRPITMMAERGSLVRTIHGPRVVMINGNRQEVERDSGRLKMLYFERNTINLTMVGEDADPRYREPRERRIAELFTITREDVGEQDFGRFRVEGHRRLATPLVNLGYVLIGLAALLGGGFGRVGQAPRVIAAVMIVVVLQAAMLGIWNLTAKQLELVPLMYVQAVLPALLSYYVLRQGPPRGAPRLVAAGGRAVG